MIGPRRLRLASAYAVRGGLLLALVVWTVMLEWSTSATLTAVVVYLCLQVPLVWWASRGQGTGSDREPEAGGFLPTGTAALLDHGVSWCLALLVAFLDLTPGPGWPALIVLATAVAASVALVRRDLPVPPLLWQATTPVAAVPLLVQTGFGTGPEREWNPEIALGTVLLVEAVILAVVLRDGHRGRIDARIAPHGIAAAAVGLTFLLTERWTDGTTGLLVRCLQGSLPGCRGPWPHRRCSCRSVGGLGPGSLP